MSSAFPLCRTSRLSQSVNVGNVEFRQLHEVSQCSLPALCRAFIERGARGVFLIYTSKRVSGFPSSSLVYSLEFSVSGKLEVKPYSNIQCIMNYAIMN